MTKPPNQYDILNEAYIRVCKKNGVDALGFLTSVACEMWSDYESESKWEWGEK